jgi:uncharacterized protein DUF4410
MKRVSIAAIVLCCALFAGCAGTSLRVSEQYQPSAGQRFTYDIINKAPMSDEGLAIMRERLTSQLAASGLLATSADGSARAVQIVIENYYMRHGATRAMVGVMAGSDNILSTIVVKDVKTGTALSKFEVQSKNPTAWGTSRGMIEDHADKIVNYLKSGQL